MRFVVDEELYSWWNMQLHCIVIRWRMWRRHYIVKATRRTVKFDLCHITTIIITIVVHLIIHQAAISGYTISTFLTTLSSWHAISSSLLSSTPSGVGKVMQRVIIYSTVSILEHFPSVLWPVKKNWCWFVGGNDLTEPLHDL